MHLFLWLIGVAMAALTQTAAAETKNLPEDFFWERTREIAVARSAAPQAVSARATIWVLTPGGYEIAAEGSNGFNCLVMRGWSLPMTAEIFGWPSLVAPICFDPVASGSPMREQMMRSDLGMAGMTREEILTEIEAAYDDGRLKALSGAAFAYMYSRDQVLGPNVGRWHPHFMIYAPYYTNEMLGDNPFASNDPIIVEAPGTPRATVAVPVDARTAPIDPHH
jgi:hypothetical protein